MVLWTVLLHMYGTTGMYVCKYVCTVNTACTNWDNRFYIGSYCIILTVLCDIPMYNIVWAMLAVWDNWFLK